MIKPIFRAQVVVLLLGWMMVAASIVGPGGDSGALWLLSSPLGRERWPASWFACPSGEWRKRSPVSPGTCLPRSLEQRRAQLALVSLS